MRKSKFTDKQIVEILKSIAGSISIFVSKEIINEISLTSFTTNQFTTISKEVLSNYMILSMPLNT